MTKKKNNMKKNLIQKLDDDILNRIIIVLSILCFLGLFYLLTVYITNKNSDDTSDKKEEKEDVSISYDEIILGRSLGMSDGEYLVLCYDQSNNELVEKYSEFVRTYKNKEDAKKIYTVDMSNSFNKSFSTEEESNKNPSEVKDLAINGPTLFKVTDKHISEYIEGEEAISNYLK